MINNTHFISNTKVPEDRTVFIKYLDNFSILNSNIQVINILQQNQRNIEIDINGLMIKYNKEGLYIENRIINNADGQLLKYTGDYCKGNWNLDNNNNVIGFGTIFYKNGDTFIGSFLNFRWEGYGHYLTLQGDKIEINYKDDKKEGYEGYFVNYSKNGYGIKISKLGINTKESLN